MQVSYETMVRMHQYVMFAQRMAELKQVGIQLDNTFNDNITRIQRRIRGRITEAKFIASVLEVPTPMLELDDLDLKWLIKNATPTTNERDEFLRIIRLNPSLLEPKE